MKKGFTTLNLLLGLLCSVFVINLLYGSVSLIIKHRYQEYNQDIISALKLYQVFNLAQEVEVFENRINFKYLNENRSLVFLKDKIMMKPGTVIYFLNVVDFKFIQDQHLIYLQILRNKHHRKFLIGEICETDLY